MAVTELTLLFMGGMAIGLGFMGLFRRFDDAWTPVLLSFSSAIIWGMFALSSQDVIVRDSAVASASEPIPPLFWLGIGMAFLTALFGIWGVYQGFAQETENTDLDGMVP